MLIQRPEEPDGMRDETKAVLIVPAGIEVTPWPLEAPALDELLAALRATHVNGGALFARFRLGARPPLRAFGAYDLRASGDTLVDPRLPRRGGFRPSCDRARTAAPAVAQRLFRMPDGTYRAIPAPKATAPSRP